MRYTKILLTTKNSEWGIITHPVAMNTYQNILSFDTPELKDWFINKHLFGDENFDYKSKIKLQPSKPTSIMSDINATFRVDQKDYPNETEATLLNKDFAIILEYDDDENTPYENYTFWAINKATIEAGHLISYRCEIDIFFTYDIKDIFKDEPIQIDRAHSNRFKVDEDNLIADIWKNSINSFEEPFDQMFRFSFNNIESIWACRPRTFYSIFTKNSNAERSKAIIKDGKQIFSHLEVVIEGTSIDGWNWPVDAIYPYMPGMILGLDTPNDEETLMALAVINTIPDAKIGVSMSPILLQEAKTTGMKFKPSAILRYYDTIASGSVREIELKNYMANNYEYSFFDITRNSFLIFNKNDINDITRPFDWKKEAKIYKSPYYLIEVIDCQGNTYQIDLSNMDTRHLINILISVKVSLQGLHCIISFNSNFFSMTETNILYGIYSVYNTSTDKEINQWDQYEAEHKAQFGVQKTNAVIHSLMGVGNSIFDTISGNYFGAANSIANSWQGLANTLAMQHDLENSPKEIISGGNIQHILNSDLDTGFKKDEGEYTGRDFYQINKRWPNEIIQQKLAWLFHIAGVNYSQTFHNPNDLLKSRYYFNYIKTSMSLFENIKEEYTISQKLRALIDNSLKEGLTIWHIRDKETFKGIKHYNVNNVEMEWLD